MPLARINLREGKDAAYRREIGRVVYEALVGVGVPKDDRFQVISEYDTDSFLFDPDYIGIHRTNDLVIIQITWNEGRNPEQKRRSTKRLLLVSSLVWPRYAREEFLGAGRAALKTIGQLFSVHAQAYVTPANALIEIQQLHRTFDQQFSRLKNLLQVGSRENPVFFARLANYNAFMVSLTNLFHAGLDFSRQGQQMFLPGLSCSLFSRELFCS
jgi:4-oxalocrotonate tautomerase